MKPGDIVDGRWEVISGPVALWTIGRTDPRCDARCGGSHYHCPTCGAVTSMMGHPDPRQCEEARAEGRGNPEWCL